MKKILLVLCISFSLPPCFGQDYLITWGDDTIHCVLPADPAKEGLKPASQYRNGYRSITAILGKESIRVVQAGETKGSLRQVAGKNLWYGEHF